MTTQERELEMRSVRTLMALGAVVALALTACGDDDDDSASDATTATTGAASQTTAAGTGTTASGASGSGETVTVTALDYEYEGIPETVEPGTKFVLENTAPAELHEMVAMKLPAGETRSVEELLALPPEEQAKVIPEDAPPAFVLLAPPNKGDTIPAVGDGTVTEPGRYLVACFIPQGADPDEYLNAPPSDGPPQVEGGPPHFTLGMVGEFTVE
jgi:hypothetical protein